ncbi:FGGY family carbohydrate kinase [Aquimarina gracilis]|uniref:FGGY family carbohydrate kinase n=1 Tax=Aquimarina gracilis TaxID=874422 RepID=A0ABU5ZS56_9FLAO|nr:FGGY family carbohydrate kinase [Aquimarina gracilis]MEB3344794.1 FGGY family carbohydrate kinase [Aquimarina gracilis]
MYYIGFDIGSSSIKAALVNAKTGKSVASVNEPEEEMDIISVHKEWAEQNPEFWWENVCKASKRILKENTISPNQIKGIGISYQMHGLVLLDDNGDLIRNSIIWCDSRAVEIGDRAFTEIGKEKCMDTLLNSPANFTASKLKWVRDNEPENYKRIQKFLLPGDYIAYKFSGAITTTKSGLSEGTLWDFKEDKPANWLLQHYNIDPNLIPDVVPTFSKQCELSFTGAYESGLKEGIPILYRAGDQPNNALSLNVFNEGEVAATGGTSGVIYAVTNSTRAKEGIKLNNFAHVNHSNSEPRIGKLLCINGAGIQYRWLKNNLNLETHSYQTMNSHASKVSVGSNGLQLIPFGNGAERMLDNQTIGTHICNLNLNKHTRSHIFRAALEGIAFSFVYGMEILKKDNTKIKVIRAGNDNLFRSEIFSNTVATLINQEIEIYNTTGAIGAARAAGLSDGTFKDFGTMITKNDHVMTYHPLQNQDDYKEAYKNWKRELNRILKK